MIEINEADKPKVTRTIVVYSGRFQPFHRGHYASYQKLVSKFGANNVYIGTSNVTDNSKSPFSFREKKEIATKMFGVPSNRFVKISNPYAPEEILNKYDGKTTQYIAAVGGKDADRLAGQYFKPYKGKPGYGYDEIGYVYAVPPEPNPISGTDVRKGLGTSNKEKAKKFFLKAYPKFDKEIFNLITSKLGKNLSEFGPLRGTGQAQSFNNYKADAEKELDIDDDDKTQNEDGFPGGIGTGLVLPGGYINGAPTGSANETVNTNPSPKLRPEPHPTRHETEHPSDEPDWYKKEKAYTKPQNELYDPIAKIIQNVITEDDFEQFVESYFTEKTKPNDAQKLGLVHLGYGMYGKEKGGQATHKRDKSGKLIPITDKEKQASQSLAKNKPPQAGQPVKKGQTNQDKIDKKIQQPLDKPSKTGEEMPMQEPPGKLKGDEFKTPAEKPKETKKGNPIERIKSKVKDWSSEEKEFFKKNVHKEGSPERRSWGKTIMDKAKGAGKAIMHGLKHEVEEFKTAGSAVKELMSGKKLEKHHKKALKSVGVKIAVTALFGAAGGGLAHGAAGFAKHVAIELIPHAVGETIVKGVTKAALFAEGIEDDMNSATALNIFAAAIAERMQNMKITTEMMEDMIDSYNKKKTDKKLVDKFHMAEPEDEHYVSSTGMFNRKLTPQQKIDKLNPARAIEKSKIWHQTFAHHNPDTGETEDEEGLKEGDIKTQNINDFVKYATERLKLKETPKVTLINSEQYGTTKSSLGGYDPVSKQIYVQSKGRLSADIIRTIAHEMVHRKQDELGLIRSIEEDGSTGSPIENQANAVAGILLRNYGKRNKKIYTESKQYENSENEEMISGIIDMLHQVEDLNNRKRMAIDRLKDFKKDNIKVDARDFLNKIGLGEIISVDVNPGDEVLMGKFKNKKVKVKDIGKDPHGMPTINGRQATTFRTINEVSSIGIGTDDQPNGAWLPKNAIRELGANDGSNKKDNWFKNGGYIQTDFPIADSIFGDEDALETYIKYSDDNVPRTDFPKTKFNKGEDKISMNEYQKLVQQVFRELFIEDNLITEGGAYGHMSHPFDDMNLTFGDLKNIITGALNGDLGVVREKTDGQALAISWKNGRLIAARNKGHLANAGANAMGIEDVASKFGGRGGLTDAYNFAMNDLSAAIGGLSDAQRKKIFNEGKCFMNLEVIWPTSVNVIPYGQALLVFHNTTCYDESGKAIAADQSAASTLAGMIKQINAHIQSKYTIQGPPITELPKNEHLSSQQGKYLSKLNKLQSEFGCSDSDTLGLYHQHWWEDFVNKSKVKLHKLEKEALVRRWAFGDKSFRLNTISDKKAQEWAMNNDKVNVIKKQKENMQKFEEIFLGVGADVLEFVSSVLTVHPEKAIRSMKERMKTVAQQVRGSGDVGKIQKLKTELSRLNKLGGIDRIVAAEGLVFFYNGKTYKLTGTFAPLNQILGIFYE